MRSSTALLASLFALGVAAHTKDWWIQGLPDCWESCLANTEDGCSSRNCICKTTEDSEPYLPSVVSCAVSKCNADEWALDLFLGPMELYCTAVNCPIPEDVMESAYAAASGTDETPPQSTRAVPSSTQAKSSNYKTTKSSDATVVLTSTIRTTITQTTTDSDGNTLQVVVPIAIGPTGISTGKIITSTVTGGARSSVASSSTTASQSSAAASSTPAPTQRASTSAAGARATQPPANGNGSPFENMQAVAGKWTVSRPLLGLGALAVLFMRL